MPRPALSDLPRLGGHLALDFVNTLDPRYGDERVEYLAEPVALLDWAAWAGAITEEERRHIAEVVAARPVHEHRTWRRALALREDLHLLLRPGRDRSAVLAAAESFSRELRRSYARPRLDATSDGYSVVFDGQPSLSVVVGAVTRAATELLTSSRLDRVRECDGLNCGWLFLDASKSGRRRWCSMEICGNRVKAQRYRERRGTVSQ